MMLDDYGDKWVILEVTKYVVRTLGDSGDSG